MTSDVRGPSACVSHLLEFGRSEPLKRLPIVRPEEVGDSSGRKSRSDLPMTHSSPHVE